MKNKIYLHRLSRDAILLLRADIGGQRGAVVEGEAEVLLVVEAAEEAEAVELVLGVGVVEAAQHLGLLQTRFVHYLVVPEVMQ